MIEFDIEMHLNNFRCKYKNRNRFFLQDNRSRSSWDWPVFSSSRAKFQIKEIPISSLGFGHSIFLAQNHWFYVMSATEMSAPMDISVLNPTECNVPELEAIVFEPPAPPCAPPPPPPPLTNEEKVLVSGTCKIAYMSTRITSLYS